MSIDASLETRPPSSLGAQAPRPISSSPGSPAQPSAGPRVPGRPWVVRSLIILNLAVFLLELWSGAGFLEPDDRALLRLGSLPGFSALDGQWWRMGSSMFLHAGALHLASNMVCLHQASLIEAAFGHARTLAIYLLSGLGGCLLFLIVGSHAAVVGASGAIVGLFGALATLVILRPTACPPDDRRVILRSLSLFFLLNLGAGILIPGISLAGHAGGAIVGAGVAAILILAHDRRSHAEQTAARALEILEQMISPDQSKKTEE